MKPQLLSDKKDLSWKQKMPINSNDLIQDLELNTLFNAMALEDKFTFDVVQNVILSCFENDIETIQYRQNILKDCIKNPDVIDAINKLVIEAIQCKKDRWFGIFRDHPYAILSDSVELMTEFLRIFNELKEVIAINANKFESEGFRRFFKMIQKELNDDYISEVRVHLKQLSFHDGMLIAARLGKFNKGMNYTLRQIPEKKKSWIKRLFSNRKSEYTFYIHPYDEGGIEALSNLKDRGSNTAGNALAQSCDHILDFFNMLHGELSFYIGCLNLLNRLKSSKMPMAFPTPSAPNEPRHTFTNLFDVALALSMKAPVVGNDLFAGNKTLILITGANRGGKSTFLRSIGIAQMMMQSGMFVGAEAFSANICDALFTHYQRKEDISMKSGKLDEELGRMSELVDHITSHSMILINEAFSATNEREGSEIAKQVITALLQKHIKVFFVTHLYDFTSYIYQNQIDYTIFLRAERGLDGKRTFKVKTGEPLKTSYAVDLYNKIFNE